MDIAGLKPSPGAMAPPSRSIARPIRASTARCFMHDALHWSGFDAVAPAQEGGDDPLPLRRLRAGESLVYEHQPLDQFYMVGAGCLKLFTVDANGFEQVTAFALRGDVVGLDACSTGFYAASAVALGDTTVTLLARWASLRQQAVGRTTQQLLQYTAARELRHRTEAQYLMAPSNAEVRLARFLIQFGQRQREMGLSERCLRLPMGRRDLGSFLGLAHETVSRSFTLLMQAGYLRVEQREVEIVDVEQFMAMAQATRGHSVVAGLKRKSRGAGARCVSRSDEGVEALLPVPQ
jgi:CRP/FNR family transcriptional regulator